MEKLKPLLQKVLLFLRTMVLVDLGISLVVAISFLITRPFTFAAYSDRLFWAGLGLTLLGAFVGFAASFAGRSFGIPAVIRKPEEARALLDHFDDYRAEVEKRYDTAIQIFVVGLGCIALAALIQTLFAR